MNIIITSGFPFGGEPFLIAESEYMPEDTVFFALSAKESTNKTTYEAYKIVNTKVSFKTMLYAVRGLFSPICVQEIVCMLKRKKLTIRNLLTMYAVYGYGTKCYEDILGFLKKYDENNLLFYSYWMSTHAFIAARLKKKFPNAKFITRCHGYDIYEYRTQSGYLAFRKFIFEQVDGVYPISENGKCYLLETYPMYEKLHKKVKVSYLGTMNSGKNPECSDEILKIVSCSNLVSLKRVHLIIEAISQLSIPIEWVHFGDGVCAAELKQLAKRKLNKENVRYCFKGAVSNAEILNEYKVKHFDVFINVSETEGIPVSVMEAMSFGIPVIATDVGGTREIVKNNINGFLIDKHFTNEELCDKILFFANKNCKKVQDYRISARKVWEKYFDAEKNFKEFYRNLED